MNSALGCLFILIFGFFFFFLNVALRFFRFLTGSSDHLFTRGTFGGPPFGAGQARSNAGRQRQADRQEAKGQNRASGNAHHENAGRPNSRQRRSGKIFAEDEGTYVDFEEVK